MACSVEEVDGWHARVRWRRHRPRVGGAACWPQRRGRWELRRGAGRARGGVSGTRSRPSQVIACIGETLQQRESGEMYNVLAEQLKWATGGGWEGRGGGG